MAVVHLGPKPGLLLAGLGVWGALSAVVPAQFGSQYNGAPIHYGKHDAKDAADPIAELQRKLDSGSVSLTHDAKFGYLASLLETLRAPKSTQTLVFSKTSFQFRQISPRNPRAIYFGDEVYIGSVPGAEVLEITAMDPKYGPVFYTLDQSKTRKPKFERRTHECLTCHGGARTGNWPGHVVRSVFPRPTGDVITRIKSFVTTHESPFEERWGGWYVTGQHGAMRHMGNVTVPQESDRGNDREEIRLDRELGANITDITDRIHAAAHLSPHSDIVALMVLEHQAEMHNRISRATYRVKSALHRQKETNRILGQPEGTRSEHTARVIRESAADVLEYLLLKHETPLPSPVRGTSRFAAEFARVGPRDGRGRSLRDLDLEARLFKHPCSYVIYSPSFDAMPIEVLDRVYSRLWKILSGRLGRRSWRLKRAQRQAILDILLATKQGLPAYFRAIEVR